MATRFVGILLVVLGLVNGQMHRFKGYKIPGEKGRIRRIEFFFVFGIQDDPPEFFLLNKQTPSVTFEKFKLSRVSSDYKSVQLSFLSGRQYLNDFTKIKNGNFCCRNPEESDVCPIPNRLVVAAKDQITYDLRADVVDTSISTLEFPLNRTDTYFLMISNCGDEFDGYIDGQLVVRHAYGYLPGTQFPKLVFYFYMILLHAIVLTVWTILLLKHWKTCIHFHYCIEGIIFLGIIECSVQFGDYMNWNAYGERNSALLIISILTTVIKNIFSYMLVLVASLGWGITRASLERSTVFKIQAIILLYVILDSIRQVTDEFIYYPHLPITPFLLVVLCLIPISILNIIIYYWIFSSLTDLLEILEEQKQFEKLQIFKRLLAVLIAALVLYTIALFVQVYAAASEVTTRWQVHWWLSDGVPHMLFMLVLLVMMCLWKPNQHSRKLAYFEEVPDEEELDTVAAKVGTRARVWGAELELDDGSSGDETDIPRGHRFDMPYHHSRPAGEGEEAI